MPESSGHVLETLWKTRSSSCSGACGTANRSRLWPSPESLARSQHAYALRDELDPAWAARPSRLERRGGRLTLLSEDPAGKPLSRLLGRPWDITSFLRVAVRRRVRVFGRGSRSRLA
jgi:hypothetical protein